MRATHAAFLLAAGAITAILASCGPSTSPDTEAPGASKLSGTVKVDGSSTVFPITEAVAEEFQKAHPDVHPTVGISGTGGGFKKFCAGETDISDASRPIKQSEIDAAAQKGIEFIELPIAYDGIAIVVNPANDWCDSLTVEELKRIWQPGSTVRKWSDVRPGWPDKEISLYGPGTDSGTFDYFTEAICGEEDASRSDFSANEDDNILVQGVSGDPNSLGYFGYAYYVENTDKLKLVSVDPGSGPIAPSEETIRNNTYQPLSRPIFIYVNVKAIERPEVRAFVDFYLENAAALVGQVGYVPMPDRVYELCASLVKDRKTGSEFGGSGSKVGVSVQEILEGRQAK